MHDLLQNVVARYGAVVALLLAGSAAQGYVVLDAFDWTEAGLEGWDTDEDYVELTNPGEGGHPGGYLNMGFDANRGQGEAAAIVYVPAASLFAGNWTDAMWFSFDFWSATAPPDALALHFQSSTNSQVWRYQMTPGVLPDTWETYTAPLRYSGWTYGDNLGGESEDLFLADLATVDWLGVYLFDGSLAAHDYGLDNFQLMIPEPAEVALAGGALAVTWLSLRRRRKRRRADEG